MILGSEPLTLTRYAAGAHGANGLWSEGASTASTFYGSVQPVTGRDRKALPEGLRESAIWKVYTTTELRPASQHSGTNADRVTFDGVMYDVANVTPWRSIIPHFQAILIRVSEATQ